MNKTDLFKDDPFWNSLSEANREILYRKSEEHRFSYQDIKILVDTARDLEMWDEPDLNEIWPDEESFPQKGKQLKQALINHITEHRNRLRNEPTDYSRFSPCSDHKAPQIRFIPGEKERTILGKCPVASEKTRCCNLMTLDAVINCGYDCSYCSIQSFYTQGKILFEKNLKEKLDRLDLDPEKKYHIGTGQSSDSLMWGNHENTLVYLTEFAKENPNVILELKTKSDNVSWLLENPVPANVLCTWSLNTSTIIENEEHLTASLDQRLDAARRAAEKGILVGFHFHPMVWYKGWDKDYAALFNRITGIFTPDQVALISFGTLTFIKPVIKKLRRRQFKTKILQIPMTDAEGKSSYPLSVKEEMFSLAYNSFKEWHNKVYFFLCMEDKSLWKRVFGKEYENNETFEKDMIENYFYKINNRSYERKQTKREC